MRYVQAVGTATLLLLSAAATKLCCFYYYYDYYYNDYLLFFNFKKTSDAERYIHAQLLLFSNNMHVTQFPTEPLKGQRCYEKNRWLMNAANSSEQTAPTIQRERPENASSNLTGIGTVFNQQTVPLR